MVKLLWGFSLSKEIAGSLSSKEWHFFTSYLEVIELPSSFYLGKEVEYPLQLADIELVEAHIESILTQSTCKALQVPRKLMSVHSHDR